MRIWLKILALIAVILSLFFSALYVSTGFFGKSLIISQLEALTNRKVDLGYFDVSLPLNLEIKNLNIEGFAQIDDIFISPSLTHLILGNVFFNDVRIVNPKITYVRVAKASAKAVEAAAQKTAPVLEAKPVPLPNTTAKKKFDMPFIIKRLTISDGSVDFIDHTVNKDGIKLTAKSLNFTLTDLNTSSYPAIANFELKGRIPWGEGAQEGKITLEGWINLFKKDIQAALKVEDIDGVYLAPYYSNWVDLEKARIEKAKLNFTSNIHGLNNDVQADCHLELTEIVRKPRPAEEPAEQEEKVTNIVLDTLKAQDQGKIVLDFSTTTKMDRPELGLSSLKDAIEVKLAKVRSANTMKTDEVLLVPSKLLGGLIGSVAELSKAMIDGTFAVGKELKNAVEGSFKKEPK